jgi:ceramide glucosyltransferase
MHWFAVFLGVLAATGTLTSTIFLLLTLLGSWRFHRSAAEQARAAAALTDDQLPFVSLLKPMHGIEPQLEANFESFFVLDYPRYEVIFAADHPDDAAIEIANRVRARHPHIPSQVVINGESPWPNRPAYSFACMAELTSNDILVTSDSDVIVDRNYLREVVPPLLDPKVGMLTCVYRGLNTGGLWSKLDAIGMSVEMTAGVLTANLMEGIKFGLGPTIVVRRDALDRIGGYRALRDYLSNDFVIGNMIAAAGYKVVLSGHIISHVVADMKLKKMWTRQLRWAVGTRRSRPLGHLGTGMVFAVPYGLLALISATMLDHLLIGAGLLVWSIGNRMIESLVVGWGITRDPACLRQPWLFAVRDLLGFALWVASYLVSDLAWRERSFELMNDGRIRVRESQPTIPAPQ